MIAYMYLFIHLGICTLLNTYEKGAIMHNKLACIGISKNG